MLSDSATYGATDTMQTLEVEGGALAFAERGSGFPVLFIHGTGTYSGTFSPVLGELSETVRAITYDRRGFGASAGGGPAQVLSQHISDASALLEALDARPAVIVGSSSGGVLALRLALERPELVAALVLIEPVYQVAFVPSPSTTAKMVAVEMRWALRRDPEGAALGYYRWATSYGGGGNQFDTYPDEWRRVAIGHARAALLELMLVAVPAPRSSVVRRIAKPTRIIIGDAGLPVFHRASRRAVRAMPDAREVAVPGAAHLVYTDAPGICAAEIADAAKSVGDSKPSR